MNKTIFVAIASIDDEELKHSVDYIYENAEYPERVFVGISLIAKKRKSFKDLQSIVTKYKNVRVTKQKQKYNDLSTVGVGFNRKRAEELYSGEDYFLQVDAHSFFELNWDTRIIDLFNEAVEDVGDDKVILTCIPPIYGYTEKGDVAAVGPATRYPQYELGQLFVQSVPKWGDIDSLLVVGKKFIPSVKANSAMLFGDKKFAADTGTKRTSMFYDEELIYSVELFGRGFALVFPNIEHFPIRHLDGDFCVPGHDRTFMLEYLDQEKEDMLHEKLRDHYYSYVNNPGNKDKLQKYKDYAKIDYKRGYFSLQKINIPKAYR